MMESQFILGDCFDILPTFPDQSFDSVISDVPYGMNLNNFDWDDPTTFNIPLLTSYFKKLVKEFYVFFGQMPSCLPWLNETAKLFVFKEHIVWGKRAVSPFGKDLSKTHESIFVYRHNTSQHFYKKRGSWTDVKLPLMFIDAITYSSIERQFSKYSQWIKTGKPPETKASDSKVFPTSNVTKKNYKMTLDVNYSNLWSFAPACRAVGRWQTGIFHHPCEKPVALMKRLIELTTPENAIILDPFAGSGTLAIACLETGRRYVCIEKEVEYYDIAMRRIEDWHNTPRQQELDLG